MRLALLLLSACSAPPSGAVENAAATCLDEGQRGVLADHLSALRAIHALVGGQANARRAVGFLAVPGAVVSAGAVLSAVDACTGVVSEPVCAHAVCWTVECLGGEDPGWSVGATLETTTWEGWQVAPATVLLRWAEANPELLGFTFAAEIGPPDGAMPWEATVHGTLTAETIAVAERIAGMDGLDVGLQWTGESGEVAVDGEVVASIDGNGVGAAGACAR